MCSTDSRLPGAGRLTVLVAGGLVVAGGAHAGVEVGNSGTPPVGTTMTSVLDLHQAPGSFVPQLRNGIEANSTDWPVSFFVQFDTPKGRAGCTSALVGPEAQLLAAHCVPSNGQLDLKFGTEIYHTTCDKHDAYVAGTDLSADFALCKLAKPFNLPAGSRFETLAMPALAAVTGKAVVLTGFGCTNDIASVDKIDGKYRIGVNSVVQNSNSPVPMTPFFTPDYYAPKELNNLFTGNAGANLCPGDSGGPAFESGDGPESGNQYPNRLVIGVNSRVAYADSGHLVYGPSIISATGGPSFKRWALQWACDHSANGKSVNGSAHKVCDAGKELAICGLSGQPTHCRGSGV